MTTDQRQQSKLRRAAAIAACVQAIADHYEVDPRRLVSEGAYHGNATADARALLIYHLRNSGMTLMAVSRIVRRSCDTVRRMARHGADCMLVTDRALLDSLPKLEIEPADSAPVTEAPTA